MKSLCTEVKFYADENGLAVVDASDFLIAKGEIAVESLTCPINGMPFIFAPFNSSLGSIPPNAVVAYEPIENHQGRGGNILFGDGHLSFHQVDSYRKTIATLATPKHKHSANTNDVSSGGMDSKGSKQSVCGSSKFAIIG